jgi:hypothetical protein
LLLPRHDVSTLAFLVRRYRLAYGMRLSNFGCLDRAIGCHSVGAKRKRQPAKRSFPPLKLTRNDGDHWRGVETNSNTVLPSGITLAAHGETTTAAALHLLHGS